MFIKTTRKPLKYTIYTQRVEDNWQDAWIKAVNLTSYDKAHEYAMTCTSINRMNCRVVVTRGGKFEYEKQYFDQSGCMFNQIRHAKIEGIAI